MEDNIYLFSNHCSKNDSGKELKKSLFDDIISIFEKYPDDERVIVPLLKTLERMFERDEILDEKDLL